MSLIKSFPNHFTPEKAEALAKQLKAEGDSWDYRVKHNPSGTRPSTIEVFDETVPLWANSRRMGWLSNITPRPRPSDAPVADS